MAYPRPRDRQEKGGEQNGTGRYGRHGSVVVGKNGSYMGSVQYANWQRRTRMAVGRSFV